MIIKSDYLDLDKIRRTLVSGGVIAFPTETVYALCCDARNVDAISKIYTIKERNKKRVFALFVKNPDEIHKYAHISESKMRNIKALSPGPVTYVLKFNEASNLPCGLVQDGKIGFRIPKNSIAEKILSYIDFPLVSTSINKSGEKSAHSFSDINDCMLKNIDIAVDCEQSISSGVSTVVDISGNRPFILRKGCLCDEKILSLFLRVQKQKIPADDTDTRS